MTNTNCKDKPANRANNGIHGKGAAIAVMYTRVGNPGQLLMGGKDAATAVTYYRTATRRQHGDHQVDRALAIQRQACGAAATAAGLLITSEFIDRGCSGARIGKRPGLARLLRHIDEHKPSYLIVADRARLSRSNECSQVIRRQLKRAGVNLLVANEATGLHAGADQWRQLFDAFQQQIGAVERQLDKEAEHEDRTDD